MIESISSKFITGAAAALAATSAKPDDDTQAQATRRADEPREADARDRPEVKRAERAENEPLKTTGHIGRLVNTSA